MSSDFAALTNHSLKFHHCRMSTRIYRLWQPGNPSIRVFLPDFWMKVVDPYPVRLPKHVVKFEVDKRFVAFDNTFLIIGLVYFLNN